MDILIDTHILFYALDNKLLLTIKQQDALLDERNKIYVSQVSLMEIVIKQAVGKLPEFSAVVKEIIYRLQLNDFDLMPLKNNHIASYLDIPLFENHRDPFDRFIIATAKFEGMTIMTNDAKFAQYQDIVQLWK